MPKQINLNVRVSGELSEFVSRRTGPDGTYDNTSEYVRDLIRRDKQASETEAFDRLKAELKRAFAAPEGSGTEMTTAEFMARQKSRRT
ncbi:MAG: transcriptional regulator [Anderseniella sp.]|nr:transcriptional regulator [Anderseniella sp.]